MSSLILLNDLRQICAELSSDKVTNRNKALEKFDNILTISKDDLIKLYRTSTQPLDPTWGALFNSAVDAAISHSVKVQQAEGTKTFQTLRNKNFLYDSIINRLIDYSIENDNNFLRKSHVLTSFFDGFRNRIVVKNFGKLFLQILERGIYDSLENTSDLKVDELRNVLTYLFEINIPNDDSLKLAVMRCINKTLELSQKHVQLGSEINDYFDEIKSFAIAARDDPEKGEVIKMYYLFVSELSIDFHISTCKQIQEILPIICGFYNYRMKTESKTFLFSSVSISLTTIYPNLNTGDYNTIGISLNDDWLKTLRKLMTIVEVEAKEQAIQFQRPTTTKTDACLNIFIKMSGMIVFLVNWGNNEQEEAIETRTKMSRNSDYIDTIVASTMNESKTAINQIWMEIFTELITTQPHLINLSNYITVLKSHERALQLFNCWQNLKCLRLSFYTLLKLEEKLFPKENTKTEKHIWSNIVEFLITDTSSHSDILREKHLLLQQLIRAKKSTIDDCLTLLNFILSNNSMRRNECISTICEMMRYNQCCNLDKTSEIITKLLNWLHQSCNKIDGKNLLLNVELLNENLVAETSALMVINFLDAHSHSAECISEKLQSNENLLNYKYCRKYICIEEHGKQQKKVKNTSWNEKPKRCMIQNNYELLMRLLNFEISKEANISSINVDLLRLLKMVLLLRKFFDYEIFDESTYMTCPLIKRIGVFFDNVDFHLKSIFVYQISRSEILETIQSLLEIFENICVCKPFLEFLSKQSIEGLIAFAGSILRQCDTSKSEDSKELSLITLKLLATICSSPAHSEKAFSYIKQQRLSTKENISGILSITKIFCAQNQNQEIASWFIGKLKTICQLYHMNVVISEQIIDIISEIVRYVEYFAEELQNAFVIISSFLKKAYKKFYSTQFVVKLIQSIRQITKYCPNLIVFEDFVSICLSCGKFLSSSNIAITFSVIKTVTSLMDPNWVVIDAANTEMYFNFCCKLYSSLVWSSFSMENEDYKKNSIGITIQLLTSIFAFSSYHRELAFQELGKYYAAQELTESNFYQFGQIGAYYNCSLFDFTKPYVDALLNVWCEKKQPMTSFPHFLCAKERIEFFSSYLPNICYYQLRFSPVEGLEELQLLKYGRKPQIIWKAVPVCYAYLLSFLSENTQHPSGSYIIEANNLLRTLKESGRDLLSVSYKIYWSTIYMATKQLWDECHFSAIFGFNLFCNTPRLCINLSSYKHNLRFYLQKCYSCPCSLTEGVNMLLQSDPMILLKVFAAFKFESSVFVFLGDKLKTFYWFCALAEIMINAVSEQFEGSAINNTQTFFLRDILFFILNTIGNKEVECEILRAGLYFMYYLLDKNISTFGDIILKHLSDIVCVVVSITQSREPSTITEMAINILELILCQHTLRFSESLKLLDEFPDSNIYQNLRNAQHDINKSKSTDLKCVIKDFLNTPTKGSVGLKSLKQSIADKKYELLSEDVRSSNALYDLLKQLIEIIRADDINLAIESAKCLGEIGSIKVGDISFYFECDTTFYNMESEYQNEIEFFAASLYRTLDKLLLKYDSASNSEVYAVCKDLANSKFGSKVIGVFPLFTLFLEQGRASILDQYSSISPFDFIEILKQHEHFEFNDWIKAFSSSVFRQCQWETFAELCELNLTFSESSIIPIIKILVANRQTHFDNVVAMLKQFFSRVYDTLKDEKWKTTRNIYSDKRVIKYFLNVCECIRIHNKWNLPIDILHVAKACIYCQAYFMGIMYLELWALEEKDKPKIKNAEIIRNPIFQEIATQAFKSIDCVEGISGFLDPVTSRLEYLNLEEDWSQVLLEIDASKDSDRNLYAQNLKRNGLLTLSCSNKFNSRTDYECCWRLGQWDTAVESNSHIGTLNDLEYEFEKNHFNALKSIYNREEVNCMSAIDKARQSIISMLKEISIECLQSIYKYLTWLHLLQQAEDFCQIQFALGTNTERVLQKWNLDQDLKYGNFNCTELVLSHQIALYKTAGIRAGRKINEFFKDKNAIGECIIKCIYECKSSGNMNLAIRNITLLRNIETSEQLKAKASIEDADICWKTGKSRMAKEILHNVMLNKDFVYCLERIQAHRMYGELLLETNNETFDVVYEEFFVRTFELLKKYSEHRDRILKSSSFDANEFETFNKESQKQTYETIAKYADKEHMQMDTYLNSETFRTKVQIMMKNKEEAQTLARQTKDRDKSIGINVMLRNYNIDDKEIKLLQATRSDNLCIAMENYIQFCKLDDVITSPAIYRIIALWFANKHDKKLHDKIKELIHDIPSFKFLCVLNQMSARLSSKNPLFLELLENVLVKCIEDHPHHTLHKILALVFAYADNPKSNTSSDRVDIAKNIINKARNKLNQNCIKQMELMFLALIDFANKDAGKNVSLILSDKIRKLKMLDNVQCPTMDLPISVSKEYTLTYIRKWDENVGLVGGINAPKKLMCVCSDGIARPQLLKGKDDLRQDAVMQQVLSMVNELLKIDPETNDQKLQLRTYRIVPLSMRSGILEWCKNTVPLGLYLCGDKKVEGAHKKYRPNDYTVAKCRNISMDAMKNQDFEKRHQTYLHICEKIKPVFHYFFFEKFLIPGIWFERRLAYTKSVATTSIVGYILGLGDRHVQNILIDELTAEVIHIDFGIAFEQGKIMPTPETVPFRLTRDIVAPMGISEADGIFRKACEKTMKILRKNHVFLTTILEVLLYDPLYVWKWSSQKILDGDRDGESEEKNLTAQRALLRVQDKLEGKEEGKMGTPVVEVQIQRLINEAMNTHNLCRLYPGWDPYL